MITRIFSRMMSVEGVAKNRSVDGPIALTIIGKIRDNFPDLQHFSIKNDSYKHAGHAGMLQMENRIESHFRLEIVSDKFKGMALPKRHRMIYGLLDDELQNGVHALQLTTRTPEEELKRRKR